MPWLVHFAPTLPGIGIETYVTKDTHPENGDIDYLKAILSEINEYFSDVANTSNDVCATHTIYESDYN